MPDMQLLPEDERKQAREQQGKRGHLARRAATVQANPGGVAQTGGELASQIKQFFATPPAYVKRGEYQPSAESFGALAQNLGGQAGQFLTATPQARTSAAPTAPATPGLQAPQVTREPMPYAPQAQAPALAASAAQQQMQGPPAPAAMVGSGGGEGLPANVVRTGNTYSQAPGTGGMVGSPTNAGALAQSQAMNSRIGSTGHGQGLTDMYNNLAEQMRTQRLQRRDERQQRELSNAAMTVPDAQYYNMSHEAGALAAAQGRQQAAQELLGTTGQERIAGAQLASEQERTRQQETRQDRAYALQERAADTRDTLAVRAAREKAINAKLKRQEKAETITEAGKAYLKVMSDPLIAPDTSEAKEALKAKAIEEAARAASVLGMYIDKNNPGQYVTPEEIKRAAEASGQQFTSIEEAARALGYLGGPLQ